jgi:hypothetical protein
MDIVVTFMPLNYSIRMTLDPAWFHLPIDTLKNVIRHLLGIHADYPLYLRDIDDNSIEGTIESLQNRFLITIREQHITAEVYQRARVHNDMPNVFFPPPGEEILDAGIKQRLVARIRAVQERRERDIQQRERVIQQGWFPWLFPAPERFPNVLGDPNSEGIRRAIALLDKSSVCQRVMSFFRMPKNTFLCGICHEDDKTIQGGQIWLPCGHSFHLYCIGRNMTRHTTCPYCQVEIDSISRCRPADAFMGRKTRKRRSKRVKKL